MGSPCVTETVHGRCWASAIFLLAGLLALLLPLIVPKTTCNGNLNPLTLAYAEEVCAYEQQWTKDLGQGGARISTSYYDNFHDTQPAINWTPGLLVLMALAVQLPYLLWAQAEAWMGVDLINAAQALAMKHPRGKHATSGCKDAEDVKGVLRALKAGRKNITSILLILRKAATILVYVVFFLIIQILAVPFSVDILDEFSQDGDDPLAYYRGCSVRSPKDDYDSLPCVHPVNLVLRQVYVVLSLVLIAFILLDGGDLLLWLLRLFSNTLQDPSVAACVQEAEEIRAKEAASGDADAGAAPTKPEGAPGAVDPRFATFLGSDGVLLLSLARRATSLAAFEALVLHLWEECKKYEPPVTVNAAASGAGSEENVKLMKTGSEGAAEWEKASLTEETETEKKKQETVVVSDANVDVELAEKV